MSNEAGFQSPIEAVASEWIKSPESKSVLNSLDAIVQYQHGGENPLRKAVGSQLLDPIHDIQWDLKSFEKFVNDYNAGNGYDSFYLTRPDMDGIKDKLPIKDIYHAFFWWIGVWMGGW